MKYILKTFSYENKRYYIRGKTEKECYEKLIQKKKEVCGEEPLFDEKITVEEWLNEWLVEYKQPTVSDSWFKELKKISKNIIINEIGMLKLKSIKPIHLQKIMNSKKGYSLSYTKKIYNVIREAFKTARINQLIPNDPSEPLRMPAVKKKNERRSITQLERKILLKVCENHRIGIFLKLQLFCGLRPGEAAALKWKDVDLKKKVINVNKALKRDNEIGEPKSAAGYRAIPIPDEFVSDLNKIKHSPFDYVCEKASGGHLTQQSIKRGWESVIYRMNIEMGCQTFKGAIIPPFRVADDLVMYCLRHTFCTDLQAAGIPINVARELMGHSDISITASIYTHSSSESFEDARNSINSLAERRAASL